MRRFKISCLITYECGPTIVDLEISDGFPTSYIERFRLFSGMGESFEKDKINSDKLDSVGTSPKAC